MKLRREYDAIVVGSGAAGGWAAKTLAESGVEVLVLEAGPALNPQTDFPVTANCSGENANAGRNVRQQAVQRRCGACRDYSSHLFVDDEENPYTTPPSRPFFWLRGRQVGGRMHTWGRVAFRLSDFDLKAASRDGWGADWPIEYADLQPYYDRVESFSGLYGSNDGIEHLPDGKYIGELDFTPEEQRFRRVTEDRFKDLRVITPRQFRLDFSHQWAPLVAAEATNRCTVRPNSVVSRINIDRTSGKATGVTVIDRITREQIELSTRVVVLCASTIESLRIMLNSACEKYPDGVGNSSGQLGRYLSDHCMAGLWGILPRSAASIAEGDPYDFGFTTGFYIPRFRNLERQKSNFIRGYGIEGGLGRFKVPVGTTEVPCWSLGAFGEGLPYFENRVTLDPVKKDAWGIPAANIDCRFMKNEHRMMSDAVAVIKEIAKAADLEIFNPPGIWSALQRVFLSSSVSPPGEAIHELGGARMGTDRTNSVLNKYNQCWDANNLFVTDGASFVSTGCQNSTLTIMALSVRASEYIVRQLKAGDF